MFSSACLVSKLLLATTAAPICSISVCALERGHIDFDACMHLTSRPGTLISTYIARAPITARPGLGLGHRAEPVFLVPGLRSQHSQLRQGCSISTQRLASLMVKGAKKHFYAVHTGRQTGQSIALALAAAASCAKLTICFAPGIYKTWSECQQQIDGMKGAVYKGFVTLPEAPGLRAR